MKYSKWYDKDIETSKLGFGCMRFKSNNGIVDKDKAISLIRKAYNSGVNYFDTAYVYLGGQSEPTLGEALSIYPRESFYIATKFSCWQYTDEKDMEKKFNEQLRDLGTDYVDFYLIHSMNKDRFELVKKYHILEIIKKWQSQGKIKHIGFSFHDDYETFVKILDYNDWDFCQIQFNYIDFNIQQGPKGYQELVDRKIPFIVMEPLKGGLLCNFNENIAKRLREYNSDSLTKWALRWVWSKPGVMTLLSGMNEEEQLDENLKIASEFEPMNEKELELIDSVAKDLNNVQVVGCTGCKYCMPCPKGVNIPRNLKLLNEYEMYRNKGSVEYHYSLLEEDNASAQECIKCGACMNKCPQHIAIPDFLEKVNELVGKNSK